MGRAFTAFRVFKAVLFNQPVSQSIEPDTRRLLQYADLDGDPKPVITVTVTMGDLLWQK